MYLLKYYVTMSKKNYTQADYDKVTDMYNQYQNSKDKYTPEQQEKIESMFLNAKTEISNGIEEANNKALNSIDPSILHDAQVNWLTKEQLDAKWWQWTADIVGVTKTQKNIVPNTKPIPETQPAQEAQTNNINLEPIDMRWDEAWNTWVMYEDWSSEIIRPAPEKVPDTVNRGKWWWWDRLPEIEWYKLVWDNNTKQYVYIPLFETPEAEYDWRTPEERWLVKYRDAKEQKYVYWEPMYWADPNNISWTTEDTRRDQSPENNEYLKLDKILQSFQGPQANESRKNYLEFNWFTVGSNWYYQKNWIKTRVYIDWQYDNWYSLKYQYWPWAKDYINIKSWLSDQDKVDIQLQRQWYNWPRDKNWHFIPMSDWKNYSSVNDKLNPPKKDYSNVVLPKNEYWFNFWLQNNIFTL